LKGGAHYFKLAADQGFAEAQYHCALCLIIGNIVDRNLATVFRYLKLSAENGNRKGQFAIAWMAEHGIGAFSSIDFDTAIRYYEQCSNDSAAGSVCFGCCLQLGLGIPIDFTIAAELLKRAAYFDDKNGLNSFSCCLEQGRDVDIDIRWNG
jgi:TPR repeat protein